MGITDIRLSGSYPRTLLRNLWPFVSRPYCCPPRSLQVAAVSENNRDVHSQVRKFGERERRDKEKRILRFLSRKKKKKSGGKKGEKKVSGGEKNAAALLSILSIPSSYGDAYITLCGPARGLRSGRAG